MRLSRFYCFLLLFSFAIILAEKAIPHHHEYNGEAILPDFNSEKDEPANHNEEGEEIHSNFYKPATTLQQIKSELLPFIVVFHLFNNTFLFGQQEPYVIRYQLLPKILQAQLVYVLNYSLKAPPY